MSGFGAESEKFAAEWLINQGFELIAQNYRSRYGEIDIILRDSDYILFVEVKARSQSALSKAREAVVPSKQRKIIKTALMYLSQYPLDLQPRFDVAEVYYKNKYKFEDVEIHYIKNAFTAEGFLL